MNINTTNQESTKVVYVGRPTNPGVLDHPSPCWVCHTTIPFTYVSFLQYFIVLKTQCIVIVQYIYKNSYHSNIISWEFTGVQNSKIGVHAKKTNFGNNIVIFELATSNFCRKNLWPIPNRSSNFVQKLAHPVFYMTKTRQWVELSSVNYDIDWALWPYCTIISENMHLRWINCHKTMEMGQKFEISQDRDYVP